jgi:hypothetical protein
VQYGSVKKHYNRRIQTPDGKYQNGRKEIDMKTIATRTGSEIGRASCRERVS